MPRNLLSKRRPLRHPVNKPPPRHKRRLYLPPLGPTGRCHPYYQIVLRQIAQHKRYPAQAKRIRQEGLVEISFEIGADGRLLSAQVSQSSQIQSLDTAALAAVTAASPFPYTRRVRRKPPEFEPAD